MFNPEPSFNLKSLWNKLGTFYSRMTPEGKQILETYWDALFRGMEGLYYDLYQVNLSSYLETSPGFIEHGYIDYSIVFEGTSKNTQLLPQVSGSYYFDLPDEGLYLSIPTLSGKNTGQVLYENVDYEIHNFNQIKFLRNLFVGSIGTGAKRINIPQRVPLASDAEQAIVGNPNNLPHSISETFLAQQAITLVPSLSNFIIPAFGREEPQILLESGYYEPYTSGWRSGTVSYVEMRKQWAKHLTRWAQGMIASFSKPPTLPNLEQTYSLVRGFPFAYRGGVVSEINKDVEGENEEMWDYVTIKVDENTNAYVALGAVWNTQLITKTEGNFFRVFSNVAPPAPNGAGSTALSVPTLHDFWIPLNPRESGESYMLMKGNVGVHMNGIPFRALSEVSHEEDAQWIKNHLWGDGEVGTESTNYDIYNGSIDLDQAYYYGGDPLSTYTETEGVHSPIIGYSLDGFPIYGKYGYTNQDGSGEVSKMSSSYRLITDWSRPIHVGGGSHTGEYRNDFQFIEGEGTLDVNNGRFASTPEYPDGIYHYHVTEEFPYLMGNFAGYPSFNNSALPALSVANLSSSQESDTYEIPSGGKYLFDEGDPINKFDILLSGIQFFDYLTNAEVIDGIVTASGTTQKFDVTVAQDFEYKKGYVMGGLSEYVIYTGSFLQDSDVNYVDILSDTDSKIDSGHRHIGLSGWEQQTPNLFNLGTGFNYDPALPTTDAVYQSFIGQSDIEPSYEGTIEGTDTISGQYTTERNTATPQRTGSGFKGEDNDTGNDGGNPSY